MANSFDFNTIPEGCVASPKDASRFALVSTGFQSASESDLVWERFLPSDCNHIVSRSVAGDGLLAEFRSKKQLYFRLADHPLLVDSHSKSFWLEKSSGKKCWMILVQGVYRLHGVIHPDTGNGLPSRNQVAELVNVCWLDIGAKIRTSILSPDTQYDAYLVYKMTSNAYGFDNEIEVTVRDTSGGNITRRAYVANQQGIRARRRTGRATSEAIANRRSDGWEELKIGEFLSGSKEEDDGEVEVSVREVEALNWKTGLVVQGIELRPIRY